MITLINAPNRRAALGGLDQGAARPPEGFTLLGRTVIVLLLLALIFGGGACIMMLA